MSKFLVVYNHDTCNGDGTKDEWETFDTVEEAERFYIDNVDEYACNAISVCVCIKSSDYETVEFRSGTVDAQERAALNARVEELGKKIVVQERTINELRGPHTNEGPFTVGATGDAGDTGDDFSEYTINAPNHNSQIIVYRDESLRNRIISLLNDDGEDT